MEKKQLLIVGAAVAVVAGVIGVILWRSLAMQEVFLKVSDRNQTPGVTVTVNRAKDGSLLTQGKTDRKGSFQDTLRLRRGEEVEIAFQKQSYRIEPEITRAKAEGTPPTILQPFEAIRIAKRLLFSVRNRVPGVEVFGVNRKGIRKSLGKTDKSGILRKRIRKSDYERITFSYSFQGGTVVSSAEESYNYEQLPKRIELSVLPQENLSFYFRCINKATNSGLENVKITSPKVPEGSYSNLSGVATVTMSPDNESGPFIGDTLSWVIEKKKFKVFEKYVSVITPSVFQYPEEAQAYTYTLDRIYKMVIKVSENNTPVPGVNLVLNGSDFDKTDESGQVVYVYHGTNIGETVEIEVSELGLSSERKSIVLGRLETPVAIPVSTIHVFLKLVDSATNEAVDGLKVQLKRKEVGIREKTGTVKVMVPKLDSYDFLILGSDKGYIDKRYNITIGKEQIGETFSILIDPITGVSFKFVDILTLEPLGGVAISREGKKRGKSEKDGTFREDFDPDPSKKYVYKFTKDYYMLRTRDIFRTPGRKVEEVELDPLVATLRAQDENGSPVSELDMSMNDKPVGKTDNLGEISFNPERVGETYTVKFVSPEGVYETKKVDFKFGSQGQIMFFVIRKQPWIEFSVFQPSIYGPIPIEEVAVTPSEGVGGETDSSGIFRYKVLKRSKPINFTFSKHGYEEIARQVVPTDNLTGISVSVPRLQAFLYVYDSITKAPVGNLEVSVNGEYQTNTQPDNGRADIFPDEKPSTLKIFIRSPEGAYFPLEETVRYKNSNLGDFEVEPRPIQVHVILHWADTGQPFRGTLEIDHPYKKYVLKKKDKGRHTFEFYDRQLKPNLIVSGKTPGGTFSRKIRIILPSDPSVYEKTISENLRPRPMVTILVDTGVTITVLQDIPIGYQVFFSDYEGNYHGEFPGFGAYTIVQTGSGFLRPDSIPILVSSANDTFNLISDEACKKAKEFYSNGQWKLFLDQVEKVKERDDCLCDMNDKAGQVAMDNLKAYERAVQFLDKVAYIKRCSEQWKSPYLHLRRLQCYVELERYEDGKTAAQDFENFVHLLPPNDKENAICQKRYLLGQLLYREYYRLEASKKKAVSPIKKDDIKQQQSSIRKEAIEYIEKYQATRGNCSSLANELNTLK